MPLGSRDLWAYAAQGQLVRHGLDPYTLGPSALPGSFAEEVSHRWVDTPAPYGPLWLTLDRFVAVRGHQRLGRGGRAEAVRGRSVSCCSRGRCRCWPQRAGGRADLAIWVGLANPLVLVLGVGGGHNDLLMVGLMAAALVVATGPGSWLRTLGLATVHRDRGDRDQVAGRRRAGLPGAAVAAPRAVGREAGAIGAASCSRRLDRRRRRRSRCSPRSPRSAGWAGAGSSWSIRPPRS